MQEVESKNFKFVFLSGGSDAKMGCLRCMLQLIQCNIYTLFSYRFKSGSMWAFKAIFCFKEAFTRGLVESTVLPWNYWLNSRWLIIQFELSLKLRLADVVLRDQDEWFAIFLFCYEFFICCFFESLKFNSFDHEIPQLLCSIMPRCCQQIEFRQLWNKSRCFPCCYLDALTLRSFLSGSRVRKRNFPVTFD